MISAWIRKCPYISSSCMLRRHYPAKCQMDEISCCLLGMYVPTKMVALCRSRGLLKNRVVSIAITTVGTIKVDVDGESYHYESVTWFRDVSPRIDIGELFPLETFLQINRRRDHQQQTSWRIEK